jgi:hypothetical protein
MEARCCCGELRLPIHGAVGLNGVCHCENCRRRTGSAFGWSIYFMASEVGEPEGAHVVYAFEGQRGPQERTFCAGCGTTVFWRSSAFPAVVGVAAGCLPPEGRREPMVSATDPACLDWITLPSTWQRWP